MPLERQRTCVSAKLADEQLQQALAKALGVVRQKSAVALSELADAEADMEYLGRLRRHHIGRLGELLRQFEKTVQGEGTHVLWAQDGAEACRIIVDLVRSRGIRSAVLSKSMVAEEVGLEAALERASVVCTQTDLGERVVQVAGQRPSHVTAPCIHLNARQIGELLAARLGMPATAEPEAISRFLAQHLRPAFLEAGLGISGANLAVASTGQLVMVENEGNVRMGYTLPPLHVVILGLEKVVETPQEALDLLSVLPRVATGQRASSYVSWLSPKPLPGQERFVVLLDNGRSTMAETELHRLVLACVRCGRCMNVCPVYERVGGHAYGWTYPGPIGLALTPFLSPDEVATDVMNLCTSCGACSDVCPVRIPLDLAIVLGRALMRKRMEPSELEVHQRWARRFASAWGSPAKYRWSHTAHLMAIRWAPGKVARVAQSVGWGDRRPAPSPARKLFRDWWLEVGLARYGRRHG